MSSNKYPKLDTMSSEFIAEIKDDLSGLEPDLLAMEEKGAGVDDDLINHAFRAIHSIKGSAGFIDFKDLSSLSHAMENVLMSIREKKLDIDSNVVDALLSGFDKMKLMVEMVGTDQTTDHTEETLVLEAILAEAAAREQETAGECPEPEPEKTLEVLTPMGDGPCFKDKTFYVEKTRLQNALNSQKFIYAIYIRYEEDLKTKKKDAKSILEDIRSIGDILYSGLDEIHTPFYCIISTILDLPLLSQVLEIDTGQMALMDKQFTDCEKILKSIPDKQTASEDPETAPDEIQERPIPEKEESEASESPHLKIKPDAPASSGSQTIRINVDLVSRLMNRAGELVLSRNQLRSFMESAANGNNHALRIMQNLDMVAADIQESIMQMRMQPVVDLLGKYRRVVRDIARRMDKNVDLVLEGTTVEVDRNVLENLVNPLTHLIRNCIDHGIEPPDERMKKGKPETGTIHIKTAHQGGHVHMTITDDGAGIDPQLILSKAFEKGLVSEEEVNRLSEKEKINLIFLPGFSTSKEITDISGRGVGMDVVKTNIERLRGQIDVDSEKGEGTTIELIIPLTLAIVPSLIVSTGEMKFAIPQANIKEVIQLEPGRLQKQVCSIAGFEVLRLREHLIPVLRLRNVLDLRTYINFPGMTEKQEEKRKAIADRRQEEEATAEQDERRQEKDRRRLEWDSTYVILLKLGAGLFGLCVDELHDIEEVVVEPLNEYIRHLKCFAGATILGDGQVVMILDVPGIAVHADLEFDSIRKEELRRNRLKEKEAPKAEAKDLIVFSSGEAEYFAMELKDVKRLEPINKEKIHQTDRLRYVEQGKEAVLVFSMDEFIPARPLELKDNEMFVIFPKTDTARVGIMASKIVDTIQVRDGLSRDVVCADAVKGKLFVDNMMVQVLDHEKFKDLINKKVNSEKEA